ncbi:hypothetical protein [Cyanobium sp. ATX-6F1]|uniref:hypothetical protein n=1 Tax=Cyanobium sp. ATX-6F1 TaxID=3137388 RepID=UPI0039BDD5D1
MEQPQGRRGPDPQSPRALLPRWGELQATAIVSSPAGTVSVVIGPPLALNWIWTP